MLQGRGAFAKWQRFARARTFAPYLAIRKRKAVVRCCCARACSYMDARACTDQNKCLHARPLLAPSLRFWCTARQSIVMRAGPARYAPRTPRPGTMARRAALRQWSLHGRKPTARRPALAGGLRGASQPRGPTGSACEPGSTDPRPSQTKARPWRCSATPQPSGPPGPPGEPPRPLSEQARWPAGTEHDGQAPPPAPWQVVACHAGHHGLALAPARGRPARALGTTARRHHLAQWPDGAAPRRAPRPSAADTRHCG